jgi:hypothetical protein
VLEEMIPTIGIHSMFVVPPFAGATTKEEGGGLTRSGELREKLANFGENR